MRRPSRPLFPYYPNMGQHVTFCPFLTPVVNGGPISLSTKEK